MAPVGAGGTIPRTATSPQRPWTIRLSDEAVGWLRECHRQPEPQRQVARHFQRIFDLLGEQGTWIGMPYVRHIRGKLWEVRVSHPTGAYRMFFGTGPGRTLAVACGDVKKSHRFPPHVYDWAERKVNEYLAELTDREE